MATLTIPVPSPASLRRFPARRGLQGRQPAAQLHKWRSVFAAVRRACIGHIRHNLWCGAVNACCTSPQPRGVCGGCATMGLGRHHMSMPSPGWVHAGDVLSWPATSCGATLVRQHHGSLSGQLGWRAHGLAAWHDNGRALDMPSAMVNTIPQAGPPLIKADIGETQCQASSNCELSICESFTGQGYHC